MLTEMAERIRGAPLTHLQAWRRVGTMAQQELAQAAKLSSSTVLRAERGDEIVSFPNIRKLAAALGITPEQLQAGPPPADYLRWYSPPTPGGAPGGAE